MTPKEEFEAEFQSRTLAYHPGLSRATEPLVIVIGEDAHTPAGHALLTILSNLVARAHRHVLYVGDVDVPLLCRDPFGATSLAEATVGRARSVNPFISIDVVPTPPRHSLLTLGVGTRRERAVELGLGCAGWDARLEPNAPVGTDRASIWGAALAACLGANTGLRRILGDRTVPLGVFSLWDDVRSGGQPGPSFEGPIDVGRVLQVGAGAVGSALDYILAFIGVRGRWMIVDGDLVDISNLNRQPLFVARDAGFPDSERVNKAERAAAVLGGDARFSPCWYGDDADVVGDRYDVVLALANERGVRSFLQGRQPTVLLHATTSANWQAQLHRHIAGRDDCIDCRLPGNVADFLCGTQEVSADDQKFDAAIPPLSATAGVLLATQLVKLQIGALVDSDHNFVAVELSSPIPVIQRKIRHCRNGCRVRRAAATRRRLDRDSRWVSLDGAGA